MGGSDSARGQSGSRSWAWAFMRKWICAGVRQDSRSSQARAKRKSSSVSTTRAASARSGVAATSTQ